MRNIQQIFISNTPEARKRIEGRLNGSTVKENGVTYRIEEASLVWKGDKIGWYFQAKQSRISIVEPVTAITFTDDEVDEIIGEVSTNTEPTKEGEGEEESSGFETAADIATDFIPFVGSGKDLYRGIRDGDPLQIAIGTGGLLLDVFTFGGGSLVKGGIKTAVKQGAKQMAKEGAEQAGKELLEKGIKEGVEQVAKHADEAGDLAKHADDLPVGRGKPPNNTPPPGGGRPGGGRPNAGSILQEASESAFKAADDIGEWIPKNKHLLTGGSKSKAKFLTDDLDEVRGLVQEALRSSDARFLPNPNIPGTFRVVTDLGRSVGRNGRQGLRVIVGFDGKVINAFPVHIH